MEKKETSNTVQINHLQLSPNLKEEDWFSFSII